MLAGTADSLLFLVQLSLVFDGLLLLSLDERLLPLRSSLAEVVIEHLYAFIHTAQVPIKSVLLVRLVLKILNAEVSTIIIHLIKQLLYGLVAILDLYACLRPQSRHGLELNSLMFGIERLIQRLLLLEIEVEVLRFVLVK